MNLACPILSRLNSAMVASPRLRELLKVRVNVSASLHLQIILNYVIAKSDRDSQSFLSHSRVLGKRIIFKAAICEGTRITRDHPGSFLSTVESPVAQATAKRLNRKAEDSEPYLAILEENWYDSVDSLKRLGRVGQPCTTSSPSCRVVFFDMLIQFGPIRNRLSVLTSR